MAAHPECAADIAPLRRHRSNLAGADADAIASTLGARPALAQNCFERVELPPFRKLNAYQLSRW